MKRKLLAVFTSVVLLCAMLPLGAVGVSAEVTSGTYNGMTYEIVDGAVTITGYTEELPADLVIPETINGYPVTTIGYSAFCQCYSLITVDIPSSITTIGELAFADCEYLISAPIPYGVTTIGDWAFADCYLLTSVIIPESVVSVGAYAFGECYSLTSVTIPDSVAYIGDQAFNGAWLTTIDVDENNANYSSWNNTLFNKEKTILIHHGRGRRASTVYAIPNGVTAISDGAFERCDYLTSITIPDSVIHIGECAFGDCDSLTDVYYSGSEANKANIAIHNESNYDNHDLLNATWHYNCINPKDHYNADVQHSVMDTEKGNGLAFRFELSANNVAVKNRIEADLVNATINYLGKDVKLVGMGAVMSNDATIAATAFTLEDVNDITVLNIPAIYLCDLEPDSCAFAVRIINIPDSQVERTIYARPYYVVEVDGEEIVVYGDVDAASCAEYM